MVGKNQILEAIQEGVIKAQKIYNKAASSPLCWAPEYFIDVNVFQSLFKITGRDSLTLQNNKKSLEKMKAIKPKRKKSIDNLIDMSYNPRFDIILWEPDQGNVVAFMETKKNARGCLKDVERICSAMEQGGKFGVLISTIHQEYKPTDDSTDLEAAKQKLKDKLDNVTDDIQKTIKPKTRFKASLFDKKHEMAIVDSTDDEENPLSWVWRPVILIIERI